MSSFQARQLLPSFLLLLWLQQLPAASLSSSCLLLLFLPLLLLLFVFVGTNQSVSWAAGDYISMPILPPAQKITKIIKKQTQQKIHPTGYATEILIPCISLTIDEHSGFHSLFRCAKFEFSTVGRTKVINVQSTPCSKSGFVFLLCLSFLCGFLTWW